tara:strand:- start:992 stop:1276 length:285 start_codon:yes stop_codon:yes gene_type:complete
MGSDYGNVTMEASGQISQFTEKPTKTSDSTYVNAGVYLISSKIIQNIPQITKISLEINLIPYWIKNGTRIYGKVVKNPVLDIGTSERYNAINNL